MSPSGDIIVFNTTKGFKMAGWEQYMQSMNSRSGAGLSTVDLDNIGNSAFNMSSNPYGMVQQAYQAANAPQAGPTTDALKAIIPGALTNTLGNSASQFGGLDANKDWQAAKIEQLNLANENANAFDFTGAFNTGLSAFNSWNQYQNQNEMMDLYKQDLNKKWADSDRRDATRKNWGSAFANAGK